MRVRIPPHGCRGPAALANKSGVSGRASPEVDLTPTCEGRHRRPRRPCHYHAIHNGRERSQAVRSPPHPGQRAQPVHRDVPRPAVRHPGNDHRQRRRQLQALRRRHLPGHQHVPAGVHRGRQRQVDHDLLGRAGGRDGRAHPKPGRSPSTTPTRGCPRSCRSPVARPCRWTRAWSPSPPPFAPLGDDEFEFVSQTFSGEHGPHPDLESGFELFCQVLVPALT
jgi:hypothetical protein